MPGERRSEPPSSASAPPTSSAGNPRGPKRCGRRPPPSSRFDYLRGLRDWSRAPQPSPALRRLRRGDIVLGPQHLASSDDENSRLLIDLLCESKLLSDQLVFTD